MTKEYFISKEQHAFAFDASLPPALEVTPPCIVTFETGDKAYARLAQCETVEEIGLRNFNAVTGPLFVYGAEPGDVLRIDILGIEVETAWSVWSPGLGRWGNKTDRIQVRRIPLEGDWAIINEELKVPVEPMIGCVGLAPAHGRSSTLSPAYPWGGNMDLLELLPGASVHLPVQVHGALLSLGDLHAAMGAAEPTSVSLESAGRATVRVSVEKGMSLDYPRVRVGKETILVAIADDYVEARQLAMDQAYDYLTGEVGLEPFDAYAYASARVGLRFGGPASAIVLAVVPETTGGTIDSS
jgi:amidase